MVSQVLKRMEHEDSIRQLMKEDWQDSLSVPHLSGQWRLLTRKCCSYSICLSRR